MYNNNIRKQTRIKTKASAFTQVSVQVYVGIKQINFHNQFVNLQSLVSNSISLK